MWFYIVREIVLINPNTGNAYPQNLQFKSYRYTIKSALLSSLLAMIAVCSRITRAISGCSSVLDDQQYVRAAVRRHRSTLSLQEIKSGRLKLLCFSGPVATPARTALHSTTQLFAELHCTKIPCLALHFTFLHCSSLFCTAAVQCSAVQCSAVQCCCSASLH